ncbi:MAG: hypothetical protein BIFFINMI_03418 [Phycisphaerae bacterium]|nr:hypothetical protein [Phycisphaerae bacterium]
MHCSAHNQWRPRPASLVGLLLALAVAFAPGCRAAKKLPAPEPAAIEIVIAPDAAAAGKWLAHPRPVDHGLAEALAGLPADGPAETRTPVKVRPLPGAAWADVVAALYAAVQDAPARRVALVVGEKCPAIWLPTSEPKPGPPCPPPLEIRLESAAGDAAKVLINNQSLYDQPLSDCLKALVGIFNPEFTIIFLDASPLVAWSDVASAFGQAVSAGYRNIKLGASARGCPGIGAKLFIDADAVAAVADRERAGRPAPADPELADALISPNYGPSQLIRPGFDPDRPAAAPEPGVRFFGLDAPQSTKRIVYVLGYSGSIDATFAYAQVEAIRSIDALPPDTQFQAISFRDGKPDELTVAGKAGLHLATTEAKAGARDWIGNLGGMEPSGANDPRPALERAFKVAGGPPEVIYLLTNRQIPEETLDAIDKLNPGHAVRINTIAFGNDVGGNLLKRIAERNGGAYRIVREADVGADY